MTDNRTTELLRKLLDERGVKWNDGDASFEVEWSTPDGRKCSAMYWKPTLTVLISGCTPEQAIAATLGRQKAKAHPYGYEPDTGAFDCTRCECGCINDISAKYCNDCGGEIEVDMYAEKEIYHCPRHLVFAEKHDDGSLEFDGKRYIAATLGRGTLTAEHVRDAVLENFEETHETRYDHWEPSKFDWQAIADELNAELGSETCELVETDSYRNANETIHVLECSACGETCEHVNGSYPKCPHCGRKAVKR